MKDINIANERHQYSQLFMLDSSTAVAKRLEHQANKNCKKNVMEKLDQILRQYNPYYNSYKRMYEVEKEEEEKAKSKWNNYNSSTHGV